MGEHRHQKTGAVVVVGAGLVNFREIKSQKTDGIKLKLKLGSKLVQLSSLLLLILLMLLFTKPVEPTTGVEHCYADIGCFPLTSEFYHPRHRPVNVYPWHRSRIKIQFELFNRKHPDGLILRPWNHINLRHSAFDPLLETKIIIPGWLDHLRRTIWVQRMRDSLLWLWAPVNIIVVHWRNFTPYTIATANTRVVGAELANMLMWLERDLRYDRSYHHLIGHSLGAHVAGYCGDRLPGLGRITGLDTARPFFQHMPKSVRLDRGDARFVDAIHSDFTPENAILLLMSYGMTTPVGHLDFYPNGPPLLQPGCLRDTIFAAHNGFQKGVVEKNSLTMAILDSMRYMTACDHQRSHEWFLESITNRQCLFVGVRCSQFEGLINGRCSCDDSRSACAIMGIHADQMYLHQAHEDLWPAKYRRYKPTKTFRRPPLINPNEIMQEDPTREQVYFRLKHQASRLRDPPQTASVDQAIGAELAVKQDTMFIEYLKANLLESKRREAKNFDGLQSRQDGHFTTLLSEPNMDDVYPINRHPKLLSHLDEDIESWYEGSSRWHLKTNHRPDYCVNQYQVLVFIGPLRSTQGHRKIRANLVISLIGSRGQLLNQRFVPRSSQLDSFTMQPFFILLEGSYSLGTIVSVAIGWEQRLDPDPIQATVAFKSPLLEQVQQMVPAYNAKHPWLSETLEYDHSDSFQWSPRLKKPPTPREELALKDNSLERRSDEDSGISVEEACDSQQCHGNQIQNQINKTEAAQTEAADGGAKAVEELSAMVAQVEQLLAGETRLLEAANDLFKANEDGGDNNIIIDSLPPPQLAEEPLPAHSLTNLPSIQEINKHNELLEALNDYHQGDQLIPSGALHNIPIQLDRDFENSIVVSQVQVNPIQATYGSTGERIGKLFCPPRPGQRLQRDQTIRLMPSLFGDCRNHQTRLVPEEPEEPTIKLY